MKKIFYVEAVTGEYEDRMVREIASYPTVQSARAHATAANLYAEQHGVHTHTSARYRAGYDEKIAAMLGNPFDPEGCVACTGVEYRTCECSTCECSTEPSHATFADYKKAHGA